MRVGNYALQLSSQAINRCRGYPIEAVSKDQLINRLQVNHLGSSFQTCLQTGRSYRSGNSIKRQALGFNQGHTHRSCCRKHSQFEKHSNLQLSSEFRFRKNYRTSSNIFGKPDILTCFSCNVSDTFGAWIFWENLITRWIFQNFHFNFITFKAQ